MLETFEDTIATRFQLERDSKINKVCDLKEAIQGNVRPGMTLHFSMAGPRWVTAAIYELARQFWGTKPAFTIDCMSANHPVAVLARGGLIKRLVTSYFSDPYYTLSPNAVYPAAQKEGLEIEHWSLLTFLLRLKAGAMGVKFMPTKSLIGSSMAEENRGSLQIIDDPFQSGQKIALVKALTPDLSICHGWAADKEGNTIFLPPLGEGLYGAMASREGAIVTVEKVVSSDYIRSHAHLVQLPGHFVRSVCEVPFGAHPSGLYSQGLDNFKGYAEDYEFVDQARQATRDLAKWDDWINKWVLSCQDHKDYLRKLGNKKILSLKGKADSDSWTYDLEALDKLLKTEKYSLVEMATIASTRKLKERIQERGYQTILAGAGIANLAAWLALFDLRETGYEVYLLAEIGLYGYVPTPFEPFIFNQRNWPTCKSLSDIESVLGIFMGGENNRCIASLGAAEIDKYGNINTTRIGTDRLIAGSGGGNDAASAAQEIIVTAIHAQHRFLDKVSYITGPGKRVKTLVSTLGVFEKLGEDEEFTLTGYLPNPEFSTPEEHIRHIKENCSWELKVCDRPQQVLPPTAEELKLLRIFDPNRYFLGKQP